MILRRVIDHLRKQEWTAIFLDFVIVVVGVFIGMQVNNWNEGRSERAAEIGYLRAMQGDAAESIKALETQVERLELQGVARKKLYEYAIDPDATLDPDERDALISAGLYDLGSTRISTLTFDALQSSGGLEIIRDPALQRKLQELGAAILAERRVQDNEDSTVREIIDPLLIANFDMANVLRQINVPSVSKVEWLNQPAPRAPAPAIMKSQEFVNLVLYRVDVGQGRLKNNKRLLEVHKEIAQLIDARLTKLGGAP